MTTERNRATIPPNRPIATRALAFAALALSALASPAAAVQLEVRYEGVLIPHGGTHDFGEVFVGDQPIYHLTVKNVDTSPVHISGTSITYNTNDPGYFSYFDSDLGVLDPGDVGSYDIQFHADALGSVTNRVDFAVSGIPRWHFYVSATTVEPPDLSLLGGIYSVPVSHNGGYAVGTVYRDQEAWVPFFVNNDGGSDLDVSQIDWTGDRIAEVSGPTGPIPPGETGGFSLWLKTDLPGSYTPQVRIHSNDPSPQPFVFTLSWTVSELVGPVLRLQLGSTVIGDGQTVSLGTTGVGTPLTRTFTAYNDGDQPMTFSTISLGYDAGDPASWDVSFGNVQNVPPGGNATFQLSYVSPTPGSSTVEVRPFVQGLDPTFEFFATGTTSLPDFSVDVSPGSRTVAPGQHADYTVATEALYGYSGTLTLSASGLPAGTSATFTPPSVAAGGTSQLRISTSGSTPPATKTFTVTGTDGSTSRSDTAQIVIQNPVDFTLEVTPEIRTLVPGGQASYTVAVEPVNGFSSNVSLSVSGLPAGASHQFTPQVVAPGTASTLTVTTATTSPIDDHPLTITGTGGGRTHSDQVTLRLVPPGGEPQVDSVSPDQLPAGAVTRVTLQGENFQGAFVEVATTPAEPGDPVPAVFPDVSLVSISGDGRTLVVDVDATQPGVSGFYNLAIETAGGATGAPIRVVGLGPEVDVWTPREPARGHTYSLSMMGINLSGASISVSGGGGVDAYVLATGSNQLRGFLDVAANAATGPRTLVVVRNGHQTQVPITIVASLEESTLQVVNVTEEAALKAAAVGEAVPEVLLQELSLREGLAWSGEGASGSAGSTAALQTKGVCNGTIGWQIYQDYFVAVLPFDPGSGRVLFDILRQMELGVPVPVGVRVLAGFADLLVVLRFNCFPVTHVELCLFGNVGFEITGVGGQIYTAGGCFLGGVFFPVLSTTGNLTNFQFRTDTECTTVTPHPPVPLEEPQAEVTKNGCCTEDLRVDLTGHSFPGTIYQIDFNAQNVAVTQSTPNPAQRVCPTAVTLDPVALRPGQSGQFKGRVRNEGTDVCTYNWTLGQVGSTGPPVTLSPTSGAFTLAPSQIQELDLLASIPSQFASAQSPELRLSVSPQGAGNPVSGSSEPCVLPTSETSTFEAGAHPVYDLAAFKGHLTPSSIDWSPVQVTENPPGSGTGTIDTCWFPGSAIHRYTDQTSITGGTWALEKREPTSSSTASVSSPTSTGTTALTAGRFAP